MPKAEVGTPKWLANKMRSKGLQKLRWYCQMCQKQCRDANGFKCHVESESHQRQLLIFAQNPGRFLFDFSKEFEWNFMHILKNRHGTKRVEANRVYQEYIADKEHVHMNATRWTTLSGFVQYLGKCGKCKIDQTEKGWYVAWIDRDPETIARQEALAKKGKLDKDDEERNAEFIQRQVERAKGEGNEDDDEDDRYTEFVRASEEATVKLDINMGELGSKSKRDPVKVVDTEGKSVFRAPKAPAPAKKEKSDSKKRAKSALEEIREEEEAKKRKRREAEAAEAGPSSSSSSKSKSVKDYWLKKGIVVKIVTKSLGEKYYKQKAAVREVVDRYGAVVAVVATGAKLKLDQDHLETVIPGVGKKVLVVNGDFRGEEGTLVSIDVESFSARVRMSHDGHEADLPYEHFSKLEEQQ